MSEETKAADAKEQGGGDQPTLESLQAELNAARNEAAKEKSIRTKLQQERDAAKSAKKQETSNEDDYKKLWAEQTEKLSKIQEKVKSTSVDSVVKAKLAKAGVLPDAIDAATQLVDRGMVSWDEESGVDEVSAQAAVAKLKSQYGFMFEKKVSATDPKQPAEGKNNGAKVITRSEFDSLSAAEKVSRMATGWIVQ